MPDGDIVRSACGASSLGNLIALRDQRGGGPRQSRNSFDPEKLSASRRWSWLTEIVRTTVCAKEICGHDTTQAHHFGASRTVRVDTWLAPARKGLSPGSFTEILCLEETDIIWKDWCMFLEALRLWCLYSPTFKNPYIVRGPLCPSGGSYPSLRRICCRRGYHYAI